MEDDLKKKWKTTYFFVVENQNDYLKKKGRRPKKIKNGRQPQRKMEDEPIN